MAAAAAATPTTPLPTNLLQSSSFLIISRSFNCALQCVATLLYEEKQGKGRFQASHFLLFLRWLKVENGGKRDLSELGFENLAEIGDNDSIVWEKNDSVKRRRSRRRRGVYRFVAGSYLKVDYVWVVAVRCFPLEYLTQLCPEPHLCFHVDFVFQNSTFTTLYPNNKATTLLDNINALINF